MSGLAVAAWIGGRGLVTLSRLAGTRTVSALGGILGCSQSQKIPDCGDPFVSRSEIRRVSLSQTANHSDMEMGGGFGELGERR